MLMLAWLGGYCIATCINAS